MAAERNTTASRRMFMAGFASAAALGVVGAGAALAYVRLHDGAASQGATGVTFRAPETRYGAQKVVYHVSTRGSWRDRESEAWRLIAVVNNHINAVEPDPIALQIVFQGDGIDALRRAKSSPRLAAAFDNLRRRGVQLRVCANTLQAYHMNLETLHNVREADLVQAAVAEFVRLQQQGYSYIKF
jgi:uncharacterized protein